MLCYVGAFIGDGSPLFLSSKKIYSTDTMKKHGLETWGKIRLYCFLCLICHNDNPCTHFVHG